MPTLHERFDAAQEQSYFPRVRAALAQVASQVASEDPETPNHENRVRYARDVFVNPDAHIAYWMFGLTGSVNFGNGTSDDPAENTTDGDSALLWTMASLWDGYAGTGEPPPPPEFGSQPTNLF